MVTFRVLVYLDMIMPDSKSSKIWFYILFLPSLLAIFGLLLVLTAYTYEWGVNNKIPAALLLGLFFAELTMVISGLGIAAFIKSRPKTLLIKAMGLWNLAILVTAGITGYNIFMVF